MNDARLRRPIEGFLFIALWCALCLLYPGPRELRAGDAETSRALKVELAASPLLGVWDDVLMSENELSLALAKGAWSGALFLPLRFRLAAIGGDADAGFRYEDYDEAGDVLRILDELRVRDDALGIDFRFGSLSDVSLGRGEVLRDLTNNLNVDVPQSGLLLEFRRPLFEVKALVDAVLDPGVLALHGLVRPLHYVHGVGILKRLEIDATWATDPAAPTSLDPVVGSSRVAVSTESMSVYGAGIALPLPSKELTAVPFLSAYGLDTQGGALHIGVATLVRPDKRFELGLSTEYSYSWGEYAPTWFDKSWAATRYHSAGGLPRLAAVIHDGIIDTGHGFRARVRMARREQWSAEASFADRFGDHNTDGSLRFDAQLVYGIRIGALITHREADGIDELFESERALVVTELRAPVTSSVTARAFYGRTLREGSDGTPSLFHRGLAGVSFAGSW